MSHLKLPNFDRVLSASSSCGAPALIRHGIEDAIGKQVMLVEAEPGCLIIYHSANPLNGLADLHAISDNLVPAPIKVEWRDINDYELRWQRLSFRQGFALGVLLVLAIIWVASL